MTKNTMIGGAVKLLAWIDIVVAALFGFLAIHLIVTLLRVPPENLQLGILWIFLAAVTGLLELSLGLTLLGKQAENARQLYWTGVVMTVLLALIALGGKANPLLLLAAIPAILTGLSCICIRQRSLVKN